MKLYILIITGLLWLSGILTPAYAAQPVLKHNLPDMSSDIASINIWKPEIPMLSPAKVAAEDELPEYIGDMLTFAHKFTGLRYRRGGKTPKGFDCSGFTSYVYRQFGISLNADRQSFCCRRVRRKTQDRRDVGYRCLSMYLAYIVILTKR